MWEEADLDVLPRSRLLSMSCCNRIMSRRQEGEWVARYENSHVFRVIDRGLSRFFTSSVRVSSRPEAQRKKKGPSRPSFTSSWNREKEKKVLGEDRTGKGKNGKESRNMRGADALQNEIVCSKPSTIPVPDVQFCRIFPLEKKTDSPFKWNGSFVVRSSVVHYPCHHSCALSLSSSLDETSLPAAILHKKRDVIADNTLTVGGRRWFARNREIQPDDYCLASGSLKSGGNFLVSFEKH